MPSVIQTDPIGSQPCKENQSAAEEPEQNTITPTSGTSKKEKNRAR